MTRRFFIALLASAFCACASAASHADNGAVLVAGATGKTGQLIVQQLVAAGYRVRAFVRDEAKGRDRLGPDVEIVTGDVKNPATIAPAMAGMDFVISAIGSGGPSGDNNPEQVDYQGVRNLATAAAAAKIRQMVLMSSMGVTQEDHPLNSMFGNVLIWKGQGEQALRDSGVPYTIIRPGGLINAPGGQGRVIAVQGDPSVEEAAIPRADVATVCVEALRSPAARYKTLEVMMGDGKPVTDWNQFFAVLEPDTD